MYRCIDTIDSPSLKAGVLSSSLKIRFISGLKAGVFSLGIKQFLARRLKLKLHPNKIIIRRFSWGIDFCGYVVLSHYRIVRTKTKSRIFRRILKSSISHQLLQSYLGYFSHAKSYHAVQDLKNLFYLTLLETIYVRRA